MIPQISIQQEDYKQNELSRIKYIYSLPHFQEQLLEIQIGESNFYNILSGDIIIGHSIVTKENRLIEFYLEDQYISICNYIFALVIFDLNITSIYCKTYNSLLLNCCLQLNMKYEVVRTLFRDLSKTPAVTINDFPVRSAEKNDLPLLLSCLNDINMTKEELEKLINKNYFFLNIDNNELKGCVYICKVHDNWDVYDIGIWVNPEFRNRGIATKLFSFIINHCMENNLPSICGCAIDNIASQKILTKNGFVSKHSLIEFKL
jgi:predicted acetyltransferase